MDAEGTLATRLRGTFRLFIPLLALACGAPLIAGTAGAAGYPEKPIRMVVPTGPGGGADTSARLFAQKLSESMGQPVYIENIGGAGGIIGADRVAKSPPDGYSMLYGFNALMTMVPPMTPKMPYTSADLDPVGITYRGGYLLIASKEFPAKNVAELIALAKAQPGRIAYASTGVGSAAHLGGELLQQQAGIELLHVPFKSPGLIELMANQVQIKLEPMISAIPLVKGGRVRALAVTGTERASALLDVPTVDETLPGYQVVGWQGVWVPKGTPPEIVARLNAELVKALKAPDIQRRMSEAAAQANDPSIESMRAAISSELQQWTRVIRERNIKPDS